MANNIPKNLDYAIGTADRNAALASSKARFYATVQSLLVSELITIWKRDELPFETVLDIIEEMAIYVTLPTENGTTQIDHIIVSRYGVALIIRGVEVLLISPDKGIKKSVKIRRLASARSSVG